MGLRLDQIRAKEIIIRTNHILKKGYTTGAHTSFAFKSALQTFLATNKLSISKTIKMDNDDLDVTKGCEIIITITRNKDDLTLNKIAQKPYILKNKDCKLELYAGVGVGVVTKDGLKPPRNYPAINPKPLEVLKDLFLAYGVNLGDIYCTISVTNGEQIAKQTANAKVGVVGGISILGTTGFVKPISATAYIDSIEQELNFAKVNKYDTIIFTLGNTAYEKAKKLNTNNYIIEIGNFIYDGINLAVKKEFNNIELWLGIGKAVKVSQGFKNTHNRFGSIDFDDVQKWVDTDIKECLTIKGVRELLGNNCDSFDNIAQVKAKEQLSKWFNRDIKVKLC